MNRLSKSTASKIRILITTGDLDGIGWEVTAKALNSIGPKKGIQFIFFRGPVAGPKLHKKFKVKTVLDLSSALAEPVDGIAAIEIKSARPPARWVEDAAAACMNGAAQALVTAPLSKTSIVEAGLNDIGHTEILKRVCREENLFMGFLGKKFNVLLATDHQPLTQALKSLSLSRLSKAFKAAHQLRSLLPAAQSRRPLALVGVNPHAGEHGLLGDEEGWMTGFVEEQRRLGVRVAGPLVPDAAFLPKNWPLFSAYVCPYHDQGLIPFKMIHGFDSGVHVTLGLPFVRTSVDHGTAKELFGRNKAQAGSMRDALLTAIRLAQTKMKETL